MKTIKELCDFLLPHLEKDSYLYSFFICDTDWANAQTVKKQLNFQGNIKKYFFVLLENANTLTGVFLMMQNMAYQSVLLFLQKSQKIKGKIFLLLFFVSDFGRWAPKYYSTPRHKNQFANCTKFLIKLASRFVQFDY